MNTLLEVQVREPRTAANGKGGFVNAVRVHNAVTARFEKAVLLWMAQRTPAAINSDHLTALALVSQIFAGVAYALASQDAHALWLVNCFLALNWLGDSLDGTLARFRNQQRPRYGFYVDHIADMFGALALTAGLGCSGYLHWPIAVGLLVCFYALSIESYLATYTMGRFHLSQGIFGPTEIRILLAAGNAVAYVRSYVNIGSHDFLLFDFAGAVAIAGMAVMVLIAAVRHTMALYREETLQ